MRRPVRSSHKPANRSLIIVGATIIGMIAVVLLALAMRAPSTAPAAQVPHFIDVPSARSSPNIALRTMFIGAKDAELPLSGTGGVLFTTLVSGQVPLGATQAVVQSDSNCQPDQNGVSHCLNELMINGAKVVVQHHHKMSETPCLTPGETVILTDRQNLNG
jgi:hypothetical protein